MNFNNNLSLKYLLKTKRPVLMFHLLKYLKYSDLIRLHFVCKDAGRLCDANSDKDESSQLLRYLMAIYTLQHYSVLIY